MFHTRKIAIFISHIFGDYQQKLCQGIFDEASEFGIQVTVFTSTDGENPGTLVGEESILDISSLAEFDGIIFANSTYLEPKLEEKIRKHLLHSISAPILFINQDSSCVNNILLDNHSPFAELTEHFIKVHQKKRLCFLGCKSEEKSNSERISIFKDTLQKHNITPKEHDIYSSNYGTERMKKAWEFFCQDGRPEAVICYNDRMALDLIYTLQEQGIQIAEDISISGCDNLTISQNITPTLTTITFPTYEVGKEAVQQLVALINGTPMQLPSVIKAETRIGCSCGCQYRQTTNPYYAIKQMHEISQKERRIYQDIHMSAALHDITTLEDGMEALSQYIPYLPNCSELYICLYENWDVAPKQIQLLTSMQNLDTYEAYSDEDDYQIDDLSTFMALGYSNGKVIQPCDFLRHNILPTYLMKKTDKHLLCTPLYFEEHSYGYVILAFEDNTIHYDFHITSWINNVSSMLKRIADQKHISLLVSRLEDIYIRDELTGLYNYRGLHTMSDILLADALETGVPVFAASFDIDNLKLINKQFGHAEGNFVIQVVAGALNSFADDSIIIARTGGDEFFVLVAGFEQSDCNSYLSHIQKYIDNYNKLHQKSYTISVSFGSALSPVSSKKELDTLIRNAEQALSQQPRRS